MKKNHKLILFDNDGTLNTQFSCWRYTQQPLGIFESHGRQLLEDHLRGMMDYEEFSIKTVALWKGLKLDDFEQIINGISLRDGALEALNYFASFGYLVACVSSGFDLWKTVFEKKHKFLFSDYHANHLVTDDDKILTGEIVVEVTDDTPLKNKGFHLKKLCQKYGIEPFETIMIGDGLGDIKAFEVAGISFSISPTHQEVAESSTHVIADGSLLTLTRYFDDGIYSPERMAGKDKLK